jgi:hypothetical protein
MTTRRWFMLAAGAWTALVAGLLLAVPLAFAKRLPDPLATHWGPAGVPDRAMSLPAAMRGVVALWLAISAIGFWVALRRVSLRQRSRRASLGAAFAAGGAYVLAMTALTVWANLDAPGWRAAGHVNWQVFGVVVFALLAGVAGWRLARTGPDDRPRGAPGHAPGGGRARPFALRVAPGERAVWVSSAANRGLLGMAVLFLLGAVGCAVSVPFGAPRWIWLLGAVAAVLALAALGTCSLRVQVGDRGLAIAFGPQRWPVRRIPLGKIDRAWAEHRLPAQVGGWGYRGLPGGATLMIRGGSCLVVRYTSGGELGISVDDAERGAALLNTLTAAPPAH